MSDRDIIVPVGGIEWADGKAVAAYGPVAGDRVRLVEADREHVVHGYVESVGDGQLVVRPADFGIVDGEGPAPLLSEFEAA